MVDGGTLEMDAVEDLVGGVVGADDADEDDRTTRESDLLPGPGIEKCK